MTQNASRLYNELIKFGSQYSQWSDVRHLGVMVWMMVGMIATGSVNLTKWSSHINTKALMRKVRKDNYQDGLIIRVSIQLSYTAPRSKH